MFLDAVRLQPVGSTPSRGDAIPSHAQKDAESRAYDFERLERAVSTLVKQHARATKRNGALRVEVEEKTQRIRALEEELLAANQRRQDVIKRVDELIAQIDQVDVQLQSLEEAQ